jgi:hypothetical protein
MFFDDHPEFLETGGTSATLGRLNLRHLAIIKANEQVLRESRVVDIASHDGRWSLAALEAGAAHITGFEGRRELVRSSRRTFRANGVPKNKYRFIHGDAHEKLLQADVRADVVMCLGFLYHTARYVELIKGISDTGAEHVIIDTKVLQGVDGPLVEFRAERTNSQAFAIRDRYALGRHVLSAVPSEAALVLMLDAAGYEVDHRTDWNLLLAEHPEVRAVRRYRNGERVTFRARKKQRARPAPVTRRRHR